MTLRRRERRLLGWRQFHGQEFVSAPGGMILQAGHTPASQACGSMSLSLAVAIGDPQLLL
jgi:hypothetical protein